jgi:uncharacterized membrane protein
MFVVREIEDLARSLTRHSHDHGPVRDLNREADRRLSFHQRLAGDLARLIGSWTFVVLQALLSIFWLVLNVFAATQHWDPYPFLLLNLVLSLESAMWTVLVLMMLNQTGERERLRAQQRRTRSSSRSCSVWTAATAPPAASAAASAYPKTPRRPKGSLPLRQWRGKT